MSGAFEAAAGAFAVVGVADVAVRTGREVYAFLLGVSDAPEDIKRICDLIKDTTSLARTSKQCLDDLSKIDSPVTTMEVVTSFELSLKSLNRELKSLQVMSSRFRGTTKTWSRIRYVLDERKIGKALENLERSKGLLGNTLVMACRELSAIDHRNTESLIRCCSEQHGLQINTLARTLSETLNDRDHLLDSTLAENHQETLRKHEANEKALSSVRRSQARMLSRQACLSRTSTHIHKQTAQISKSLTETQRTVASEHQKTRDILSAEFMDILSSKIEQLSIPVKKRLDPPARRRKDILFFGERRDIMMAYLLLVKAQLEIIIRHLTTYSDGEVSLRYIAWLQSEFEHLVASAAQEEALSHAGSKATSMDRWFYSEDLFRSSSSPIERKLDFIQERTDATRNEGKSYSAVQRHNQTKYKHPEQTQQTFSHDTPFGHLRIFLPRQTGKSQDKQGDDEVGFSLTCGIGESVHVISARFFRDRFRAPSPQICTQLNVFTVAECDGHYDDLFAQGTIQEIDTALRQGIISPYHINREGRNLCLYFAAEHTRTDLFDYLESQGIGVWALNHDISVVAGFFQRSITDSDRSTYEASVDHVLDKVYDTSHFLLEMAMNMLLWDYYKGRPRSLLREHLHRLKRENLIEHVPIPPELPDDAPWDWESASSLIRPLLGSGIYLNSTGSLGRNRIQRSLCVCTSPGSRKVVEELGTALIGAGVSIHHRDDNGLTPSMYAKRYDFWDEWCSALKRNGKAVEDVVRKDKSEWLLEEDWRETWKKKYKSW